jgi:hypothetical protein
MQTEANELSSSDIGIMPLKYTMFENENAVSKPKAGNIWPVVNFSCKSIWPYPPIKK